MKIKKSFIFWAFLLVSVFCSRVRLKADTPTNTPTPSPTFTATNTPGPGQGSYNTVPSTFVSGSAGNTLDLYFTVGQVPYTTGLFNVIVPVGFDPPTGSNFYLLPAQATAYQAVENYSGQTFTAQLSNVPAGTTLRFLYGYDATGFSANTTSASVSFLVSSDPQDVNPANLAALSAQPTISIISPTATPTVTQTSTISPTFSPTPTISSTFTITMTYTQTPIGAINPNGAYSYPNPFDLRQFNKVTFVFPPDTNVKIDIFNLSGEPVAHLSPDNSSTSAGWAIWSGQDDHNNLVSGGLYFYRIAGTNNKWTGKLTLLH